MPLDIESAVNKTIETIDKGESGFHRDYRRVVELAAKYKRLITGEDIAPLLLRFNPRESEEQFKQRIALTQLVTPAVSEKIKSPFYKVSRIDNVTKKIIFNDLEQEQVEQRLENIEIAADDFYGDESLDDFMETNFVDLSFLDPNAFIAVEFNSFDPRTERAQPFPVEIPSDQAIQFQYVNNELQYLIRRIPYKFKRMDKNGKTSWVDGFIYRMYTEEFSIRFTQFDGKNANISQTFNFEEFSESNPINIKIGNNYFLVEIFYPEGGEIQLIRVGYKKDPMTNKRTCVNPFHAALPRFMKTIKSISELDLTMTLHVFQQKFQYIQACPGDVQKGDYCNKGLNRNGDKCGICRGEGVLIHKSSADAVTLPLPKDPDDMFDLDKLMVYKGPHIDLIKFQDEYTEKLEKKAMEDVFVSSTLNRVIATQTATEKELDMESIYDTLLPFANKFSTVWKKLMRLVSTFTDQAQGGITIIHKFPKDFKLKTIGALIDDLKQAKDADAPVFLKREISNDIAHKIYADDPDALNEYFVKQQHMPFTGKSSDEIQVAINSRDVRRFDKVLFANFESIMTELEKEEIENNKRDFYKLPFDTRVELIKTKVEQYIEEIDAGESTAQPFSSVPPVEAPVEETPPGEGTEEPNLEQSTT